MEEMRSYAKQLKAGPATELADNDELVVLDCMAGAGPFAVPIAKSGIQVKHWKRATDVLIC